MIKKLFNIIRKPEEPKVIWWSTIEGLEKVVPIVKAKDYIPDWWKKVERMIESKFDEKGTVRNCPSMPEFLSQGYVVPLWCDLHIKIEHDKFEWKSPEKMFSFSSHGDVQFRDWIPKHVRDNTSMVLKPNCPWRVKTPPGWSIWQLPMFYDFNPLFEVMPGIIWSDIHHEINQQMLMKRYGEFTLKRGTPLAAYVPYKRVKYETEIQGPTVENSSWTNESYLHVRTKFKGGYKLHQAEVKTNKTKGKKKKNKCPFHK